MEIIEEGLGEEMIMATEQLEASATQYAKQLAGSNYRRRVCVCEVSVVLVILQNFCVPKMEDTRNYS